MHYLKTPGAYFNDFDPSSVAWLRELMKAGLIADGVVDDRSILDVEADDLREFTQCHFFAGIGGWSYALRLAGVPDDMEVWTGSPPCQPFSVAGKQDGKNDARHLAPKFASLVRAAHPALLFGEQVASAAVFGPSAKGNRPGFEGTPPWAWLDDLSDRLEAARYAVWANDVPAAGVGGPHIRQRTFFGAVRMADAAGTGPLPGPHAGIHRGQEGAGSRDAEPERSRPVGRLADRNDAGLEGRGQPGRERAAERAFGPGGVVGGLADAQLPGGAPRRPGLVGASTEQADGRGKTGFDAGVCGVAARPPISGPVNGFWRDADWLYCRDGKWRPVEPGTFPLAHGVSGRVGLLRGYGNAIVPEAAQAFIEASLEALDDIQRLRLRSDLAGDVFA